MKKTRCATCSPTLCTGDPHNFHFESALLRAQRHYAAETRPAAERLAESDHEPERFRSWVADPLRGYRRLTDEQEQRLVLQFDGTPPAAILTALKSADFQFQYDYAGHRNVWVSLNDHRSRLQAETIESLLREQWPAAESPAR